MTDNEVSDDDQTVSSSAARFAYTNDVLATLLILSIVGATAVYVWRGDSLPLWLSTTVTVSVSTAVVWAFGRGAFKSAAEMVGGGGKNG